MNPQKNNSGQCLKIALLTLSLLAPGAPGARAQNIGDWQTTPGLAGGYWDNDKNNTADGSGTWQSWSGSAWVTQTGKFQNSSYPSNNTTVITILPGTIITNSSASSGIIADEITVSNGAALQILKGVFTVSHSTATPYDVDVFGGFGLADSSGGGVVLSNGATIAVESGGAMTNYSLTSGDSFTGPGYTNSAITFLNGSLFVQTGAKASYIPLATWNTGSTVLFAPSAAGAFFPDQFAGQNFYNFIWNWPTQSGKTGGTGNAGDVMVRGDFVIADANGQVVEDIPGLDGTLTVGGDVGITNAIWYPTASSGPATVDASGDFIIDSTATIQINNATGIGAIVFDGTNSQTLGIYGNNSSAGNFTWTVNGGSTVNLNSALTVNSGVVGGGVITDEGRLNLTANGSLSGNGSIVIAPGATFDVSQVGGGYTLAAGLTLSGGGAITGSVAVASTAIVHPGGGRTLTFGNNLTLNAGSSNIFDLTSSASSGNDQIVLHGAGGALAGGGAQITVNSAGTLATSDYMLFNVTGGGGISSGFNATPAWLGTTPVNASDYSVITNGTQVLLHYANQTVPRPRITGITLSGANLQLTGSNGVAGTYHVLTSTNVALPLADWTAVATNVLTGSGNFTITATNAVAPGFSHQFYILQTP